jgi:hypothetical protein
VTPEECIGPEALLNLVITHKSVKT